MKVLVINGGHQEAQSIALSLRLRWPECAVMPAVDESDGLELLENELPDLVFVGVSSTQWDALDLVGRIRSFCDVPLIVVTERDDEMAKISGLEIGADDYVVRPFNPVELLAKVVALLRRVRGLGMPREPEPLCLGKLELNFSTREVFVCGERIRLTPIEYSLLCHLIRNEGKVLSHINLLEKVWGRDYTDDSSFVKKYIYRLRSKLHDDAQDPKMLISERGVGYRFVKPV